MKVLSYAGECPHNKAVVCSKFDRCPGIEEGGCGKGGDAQNVHGSTAYFLERRAMIRTVKREAFCDYYTLTEAGRKALEEA